jgi:Mn-containing catalase
MIPRIDRLHSALPPPSASGLDGAAAVRELMGGRFGEVSTLLNYTFRSFNFRGPVLRRVL